MIDTTTEFGQRAEQRLREEKTGWLTTVSSAGTPIPAPIWFLYFNDPGRERIVMYSFNTAKRNENLRANPRIGFNLNCGPDGNDIVVVTGTARIAPELPAPADNPAYLEKYGEWIARDWGTPEKYAEEYGLPVEITGLKLRGW